MKKTLHVLALVASLVAVCHGHTDHVEERHIDTKPASAHNRREELQ